MSTPPTPLNIINRRQPVLFDIEIEHDPPGVGPGESVAGTVRVKCWIKQIAAHDPEEAGRKAERFLTETKGIRSMTVTGWRFFNSQRKGVQSDGTLFA